MKTTLEIPDPLFRKAKATAAQHGQTMKQFVTEALQEKLAATNGKQTGGWRAVLGKLSPEARKAAREVDAIVNAPDFRTIDEEDWK
jgi:hypothetical protein